MKSLWMRDRNQKRKEIFVPLFFFLYMPPIYFLLPSSFSMWRCSHILSFILSSIAFFLCSLQKRRSKKGSPPCYLLSSDFLRREKKKDSTAKREIYNGTSIPVILDSLDQDQSYMDTYRGRMHVQLQRTLKRSMDFKLQWRTIHAKWKIEPSSLYFIFES